MVGMVANEKIPEQCTAHTFDDLVSLDGDYLVRYAMKDLKNILPVEQDKIVYGIKQAYGIRDGSCASAILEYMKGCIPFSGDREFRFYRVLYHVIKKWSRRTVRKNLKKFEELGLLKRMYFHELGFHELDERYRTVLMKLFEWLGEKPPNLNRERVFTVEIYLPESILKQVPKPDDPLIVSNIKTIKEGDDLGLGRGEHLIDKIDLRSLSDKEKRRAIAHFVQQPFMGINLEKTYHYTHGQRKEILTQVAEGAEKLPNIKEMYSVGSVPNNEDKENSDIDILVVRKHCPGYDNCGKILKKADAVDLFCSTEEELEDARRRRLAILVGAERL